MLYTLAKKEEVLICDPSNPTFHSETQDFTSKLEISTFHSETQDFTLTLEMSTIHFEIQDFSTCCAQRTERICLVLLSQIQAKAKDSSRRVLHSYAMTKHIAVYCYCITLALQLRAIIATYSSL